MASPLVEKLRGQRNERSSLILPILVLWGIVAIVVIGFLWAETDLDSSMQDLYLLPWLFLTGVIVVAPTVYLYFTGRFDFFHPIIFAAWSYVFPAFVIGGALVAFGIVNPYFLTFVEDQHFNYPYTAALIGLGFLGLTVGYFIPVGRKIAEFLEPRFPTWNWQPDQVWIPGLLLLFAGTAVNILGFVQGLLGYQRAEEVNTFDGTLFFLFVLLTEGTVLLWLAIFGAKQRDGFWLLMLIVLVAFIPIRMAIMGNRSSLYGGLLPVAMAYIYMGGRLTRKRMVTFAGIAVIAVFIGVIYGTAFRNIKGSEARISAEDYVGRIFVTVDYLGSTDPMKLLGSSAQAMADRIDNFSSVAVVVSRHEKLAAYEESYGLQNNILNDAYTAFIPRFVWNDKPPTSDPRAYSDLYFNFSENSFAISPFGDLLRNFGPFGVPLGMLLLGIYLRVIYSALIETPYPAMWKKVAYYPLLTIVSYEGFYAHLFPSIVRYIIVIGISLVIANLFVGSLKRSTA
jgi:hypothetical protein